MPKSDNMRGALLMMLSMVAFTLNDTFIKSVSADVPLFQAVFIRGLLTTSLLGALAVGRGSFGQKIPRADLNMIGLRTIGEVGATIFFLTALFHMQIGSATAILQSLPLAIALAGAVFLGEPVGWRRYLAIVVGFVGVMLIVQPGAAGFNRYSVFALVAVGFVVLRDLTTRRLSRAVPSILVALSAAFSVTLLGAVGTVIEGWHAVPLRVVALLAGAGVFIFAGYMLAVMVMRVGNIAFVSTFRYTALIWALVLGFVVFGEVPNRLMLVGSVIVVGMGVFTLYRERRARKSAAGSSPPC